MASVETLKTFHLKAPKLQSQPSSFVFQDQVVSLTIGPKTPAAYIQSAVLGLLQNDSFKTLTRTTSGRSSPKLPAQRTPCSHCPAQISFRIHPALTLQPTLVHHTSSHHEIKNKRSLSPVALSLCCVTPS